MTLTTIATNAFSLPSWTQCSHKFSGDFNRNLKIKPNFQNHQTVRNAASVQILELKMANSTIILPDIGKTFPNLVELWIVTQRIRFVEREDFVNLSQLIELLLYKNEIRFLPENVFWDLTNLEVLDLISNRISEISENIFINLKKIKTINFGRNNIQHLPENLFINNHELESINFSENRLRTINVDFLMLANLNELYLQKSNCIDLNMITILDIIEIQQVINQNCTILAARRSLFNSY